MAMRNFGKDSDLDFLVVKEDKRRPIEVEQDLHRIIDYKIASDFIERSHENRKSSLWLRVMIQKSG